MGQDSRHGHEDPRHRDGPIRLDDQHLRNDQRGGHRGRVRVIERGTAALLLLGYGASLWLAHGYAGVVSGAWKTWLSSLGHAWPVAEAALPALVVTGLAALPFHSLWSPV